ncbi:hypothetical protein J1605_011571 [Eschrichtius robustus]|uniref:Uncharacterized protein n=1 Tax=Eschrichtius robustus TaxID=9764 RepID=A0AB34GMR1_ESCRO|nr:hypothetical protein J1605_011571 [Eschrichtius robustus]
MCSGVRAEQVADSPRATVCEQHQDARGCQPL